jgi:UDP-glucose 4-epimerase
VADALVIGGNGFIGSHLVDALVGAGHNVNVFDRFSGERPLYTADGVTAIRGDFLSKADLEGALAGRDWVFHLLSTSTPVSAEGDPTFDLRTNVAQTVDLLELCVDAGIHHVYFASTGGAIYGDQGREEYAESDPALPLSPYGIGKLTIERYLDFFHATHGLRSTSMRISNPYGPRQRAFRRQGLIPIALRNVAEGQPVARYGDGQMIRDYIYVEDVVRMIIALTEKTPVESLYNLGSGRGFTVTEVLDSIRRVTGSDFAITEVPTPPTFVRKVILDTSRFDLEFGRMDRLELDEGIRRTFADITSRK